MIRREVRKLRWEGEQEVFVNQDTGEEYRRIVGGIAWPYGEKPGYAVVVAEALKEDPQLKDRSLWVMKEIEDPDILNLLGNCRDMQEALEVQDFYGNTGDKAMMANYYHLSRKQGKARFSFKAAHYANEPNGLAFYMPIIKKYLAINRKILHFGEGSKLPGYLAQVGPGNMRTNPAELPPIAALGYVLAYLDRHKPESPRKARKSNGGSVWAV